MNINLTVLLKLPAIGYYCSYSYKNNACFKKEKVSHTIKKKKKKKNQFIYSYTVVDNSVYMWIRFAD